MNEHERTQWFHDILNRSLDTFIEYWDYPAIAAEWAKGSTSRYNILKRVEGLKFAQEHDRTGLTSFMVLRAYLHRLLHSTSFSAYDLMLNWESHKSRFDKINKMRLELEMPEALEVLNDYHNQVKAMARHYEFKDVESFDKIVESPIDLGFLRQSAITSLEQKLKTHQFLRGDPPAGPLTVNKKVFEFWNMNSVIQAAAHGLFDGVALCLIRDPEDALRSFFCFAVKAGENLYILTDREKGSHPRYEEMSRRPDRNLDSRAEENWFPYELIDLEVIETPRGDVVRPRDRKQLVPKNAEMIALANIGDLEPRSIIWLGILLEFLAKKFGTATPAQLPEFSYTAEMIRTPDVLVPAESSLIRQGKYVPLNLPFIVRADVQAGPMADNFEKASFGFNRHIVDRFKDQVPEIVLNVLGEGDIKQLAAGQEIDNTLQVGDTNRIGEVMYSDMEIRSFKPTDFGTKAELDKDRLWTARWNYIEYIKALAEKEFTQKRAGICDWYRKKVKGNRQNLLYYIALMECKLEFKGWSQEGFRDPERKSTVVDILEIRQASKKFWRILNINEYWGPNSDKGGVVFKTKQLHHESFYRCFYDGNKATVGAVFEPQDASHLAILAGVTVEELPEQLRYWFRSDRNPYTGNSILDRLDPEDWNLTDPFRRLEFQVGFAMSKTTFNNLRKEYDFAKPDYSKILDLGLQRY